MTALSNDNDSRPSLVPFYFLMFHCVWPYGGGGGNQLRIFYFL